MVTSTAVQFGELTIEKNEDSFVLHGPEARGQTASIPWEPAELSANVRTDDSGGYRPLSGARTLRAGWKILFATQADLNRALDVIYPLARIHQAQWGARTLRVITLAAVLSGQTGRYQVAADLSELGRTNVTQALCGDCVRTPVWNEETLQKGGIPCPEACSILVALCREAAIWEAGLPTGHDIDGSVAYADFGQPGNALRETVLKKMDLEQRS